MRDFEKRFQSTQRLFFGAWYSMFAFILLYFACILFFIYLVITNNEKIARAAGNMVGTFISAVKETSK